MKVLEIEGNKKGMWKAFNNTSAIVRNSPEKIFEWAKEEGFTDYKLVMLDETGKL